MPRNQNPDDPVVKLQNDRSDRYRSHSSLMEFMARLTLEKAAYPATAKAYHDGADRYGRDGEAIGPELDDVAAALEQCHEVVARVAKRTDGFDW